MINYAYATGQPATKTTREYWGYLHESGSIHLKPWFGDEKDYTEDCENNPFTQIVVPPFHAESYDAARELLTDAIIRHRAQPAGWND